LGLNISKERKIFFYQFSLMVVSGEKEGGLKTGLIDRGWYGTVALEAEKIRRLASGS